MTHTLIIAEAGVNHNGEESLAFELIDKAVEAGVDIVKFQTFKAENLVTKSAPLANYQQQNGVKENAQFDMLKTLELSSDCFIRLKRYCEEQDIMFLTTAFDFDSLNFLINTLKLNTLKIPSGEITNAPFVLAHARSGCQLIVSTGMCDLTDIEQALGVIAFGLLNIEGKFLDCQPSKTLFAKAYQSDDGKKLLQQKVTLLHCTTDYPAPIDDINLKAMITMQQAFHLPIGYSDHSQGIVVPIAAVAMKASLIEKHFTLDKNLVGPDHKASLNPAELTEMVDAIRLTERSLGKTIKQASVAEQANKLVARKSLVANCDINIGEEFTPQNLVIKRPGSGMSPYCYWSILKQKSHRHYQEGELINE
jgi:N-acetylneuraminate synthase